MSQPTSHVKVARCIFNERMGKELTLSLNDGGEAQLWDIKTWERFLKFVNDNPQVKKDEQGLYGWTFVEYMNPPADDLGNYKLLPEVTQGKEFLRLTNK